MKSGTADRATPAYPLTPTQTEQLRALMGRAPDTSDIPPAPEANWVGAVRGKHYAAMQGAVSVRLDPDLLAWLGREGRDYQVEINRILREKMLNEG